MIDERIVEILDRKYAFLRGTHSDRYVDELASFAEWLFSEDLIRPYAMQVFREDVLELDAYAEYRARVLEALHELRSEVDRVHPTALTDEAGLADHELEVRYGLTSFDRHALAPVDRAAEDDALTFDPTSAATKASILWNILRRREKALRESSANAEAVQLGERVDRLYADFQFRTEQLARRLRTSAARSFKMILSRCRMENVPPPGQLHWTDLLDDRARSRAETLSHWPDARKTKLDELQLDAERVYEAIRAALGTSLSSEAMILGFKERCTWFDQERMRQLASKGPGVREDRLCLELARYLHDRGVFSLVRSRMGNREPDAIAPFGQRRLAIEAKVHDRRESARAAVVGGFWQLHGYLTSLETRRVYAPEGFLVVFRLGGGTCEAPSMVATPRFRIHILMIDLGKSADSGRNQPKPTQITEADLIESGVRRSVNGKRISAARKRGRK